MSSSNQIEKQTLSVILAGLYLSWSTKLEVIISYSEEKKTMIVLIT